MRLFFTLIIGLSLSNLAFSQEAGFMGRRNYISANLRFYNPTFYVLSSINNSVQDAKSNTFKRTQFKDLINYAYSGSIGHSFKNNFAMSIEFGLQHGNVANGSNAQYTTFGYDSTSGNTYSYSSHSYSTPFKVRSFQIMPTFELSGSGGLSPVGLVNKLGFGICKTKVTPDDSYATYAQEIDQFGYSTTQYTKVADGKDVIDTEQVFKSALLFYELGMRLPISNKIAYYFGIRYQLGFMYGLPNSDPSYTYAYSSRTFNEDVGRYVTRNYVQANIGISYIF